MFEINNISIYIYPNRYIVKNLSLTLNKKDKLAIIGEEGNGKSTLLKVILGKCEYAGFDSSGSINFHGYKRGYLSQVADELLEKENVYDFLFSDEEDYYRKINNLYYYLDELNLKDTILKEKTLSLSGGEKVKVRLLKLLLDEVDIFFLDEPTNDLDIKTLRWLESFINKIDNPVIYVTHDETFLENTANMILHLEQIKNKTDFRYTFLKVDYETYMNFRTSTLERKTRTAKYERKEFLKQEEKLKRIMQKVEYQQNTISRKDPHGAKVLKKKMHSLKSQEKRLDNKVLTEIPDIEESIFFNFETVSIPKTKVILDLNIPKLEVNNKCLIKDIKLRVVGGEHICIIGENGSGKTTLLNEIYASIKNRKDIKVGYMPQNYDNLLSTYDNVLDFLCNNKDKEEITKARMYLGNMKFTSEEMTSKINNLSNGTKAKLILLKLVLDKCDVLLLDEPTRNLSPLSNPVIRSVLKNFNGAIISISHDRKYIMDVVDKIYIVSNKELKEVNDYSFY